jgi:hypothetical protein
MRLSRTTTLVFLGAALVVPSLLGDVSLTDKRALIAQRHAAKLQRKLQAGRHARRASGAHPLRATGALATAGTQSLIDSSGLDWFINTNVPTSSDTSSASGAATTATYTHGVAASTSAGGTTSSTLTDAYDGYNAMCVSLTNQTGPCDPSDTTNYVLYINNGPATTECPGPVSAANRQIVLPLQTIGGLTVQRKVFVPDNDSFARWMNIFTNTGGAPITFTMITSNNLGSDSDTTIVSSSSGNAVAETSDTWVTTFQNFNGGNTTSDPRLGHVLQGVGAPVPVSFINFTNGDTAPWWAYQITLAPGQTRIIVNFGVGQPTKAAANAKSALLATFPVPSTTTQCMSPTELSQVLNFTAAVLPTVPTLTPKVIALFAALLALSAVWLLRRS